MNESEEKTCPRCGARFDCRVATPTECQCAGIELSAQRTAEIHARWGDCLCPRCLRELSEAETESAG
jgi:hypothetical protein